ncbi:hypothetical protein L1N85_00040 [Paenibacillus alkaliterrae]|uniref:hypothetical protein n=1 Tax=Paenibacillus alkaliterrae TaxID=320909 RepID=UPI001F1BD8A5|nr:hypothetical protein [Paenibacillus alkaliterrae]MCF2936818.1 hypothetical protein [Paenibacillus alkaliterrae]
MSDENREYKKESCDAILDTAKTIHNEEAERFKQIEAKTSIALAFTGLLFGAFLTYVTTNAPVLKDIASLIYNSLFRLIIVALISLSAYYFLKSIKAGDYDQIDLGNIVSNSFAKEDSGKVKMGIAATYKDVVDLNGDKIESKSRHYTIGLNYISWGFTIFVVHIIVEEIIRHATR